MVYDMKYKSVFCDLDKTLLDADGKLSSYSKDIIEKLLDKGIDFVPCSGRAFNSLPVELSGVRGLKYTVTSNGVSIDDFVNKKSIDYVLVPEVIPSRLMEIVGNRNVEFECFIDGQGYASKTYVNDPFILGCRTFRPEYLQRTRIGVEDIKGFILEHKDCIGSVEVIAHPDECAEIFALLKDKLDGVYVTNSERFLIEISNVNCGKHNGLIRYCNIMGLSKEEVIAFGDGNNDIEMLDIAGLGIAVGNATPECMAHSDYVVGRHDEDGVATELKKIFDL